MNSFSVVATVVDFTVNKDGDTYRYRVTPLRHDRSVCSGAWRFRHCEADGSPQQDKGPYDVQRHADGSLSCDCLGWLRWSYCKHTECLKIFLSGRMPTPEEVAEKHRARRQAREHVT